MKNVRITYAAVNIASNGLETLDIILMTAESGKTNKRITPNAKSTKTKYGALFFIAKSGT